MAENLGYVISLHWPLDINLLINITVLFLYFTYKIMLKKYTVSSSYLTIYPLLSPTV